MDGAVGNEVVHLGTVADDNVVGGREDGNGELVTRRASKDGSEDSFLLEIFDGVDDDQRLITSADGGQVSQKVRAANKVDDAVADRAVGERAEDGIVLVRNVIVEVVLSGESKVEGAGESGELDVTFLDDVLDVGLDKDTIVHGDAAGDGNTQVIFDTRDDARRITGLGEHIVDRTGKTDLSTEEDVTHVIVSTLAVGTTLTVALDGRPLAFTGGDFVVALAQPLVHDGFILTSLDNLRKSSAERTVQGGGMDIAVMVAVSNRSTKKA